MNDEQMMRHALTLADQAAALDEVPIGAAVFFDGDVVGEGFNQKECTNDPTAHAEMIAINNAAKKNRANSFWRPRSKGRRLPNALYHCR